LGPINLGNPSEITILEVAENIIELTNSKSKIVFKTIPEDDPVRRKPDITQAKEKFGWVPKTSLEDGLFKTISYFEDLLKNNIYKISSNTG
jgi:UDP-glucuronate decarboxylase